MSDERKTIRPIRRRRNTQKVRRYRFDDPSVRDISSIAPTQNPDRPNVQVEIKTDGEPPNLETIPTNKPPPPDLFAPPEEANSRQEESTSEPELPRELVIEDLDLTNLRFKLPVGRTDAQEPPPENQTVPQEEDTEQDAINSQFSGEPHQQVFPFEKADTRFLRFEKKEPIAQKSFKVIKGMPIRIISDRPPSLDAKVGTAIAQTGLTGGTVLEEKGDTAAYEMGSRERVKVASLKPAFSEVTAEPLIDVAVVPEKKKITPLESALSEPTAEPLVDIAILPENKEVASSKPAFSEAIAEPLIDVDVSVDTATEEESERTIRDEDLEPLQASLVPGPIEVRPKKKVEPVSVEVIKEHAARPIEADVPERNRLQTSPFAEPKTISGERPSAAEIPAAIRSTPIPPPTSTAAQSGARAAGQAESRPRRPSSRPMPAAPGALHVPSPPAKSGRVSSTGISASPTATATAAPSTSSMAKQPEIAKRQTKGTRPWWERFFTDDYLKSVVLPSPAQIKRQCDFIESSLALAHGSTILDVGCGKGVHAIDLTTRGYLVVGLDLSLPMITRAAEDAQYRGLKINFLHADIREIAFDGAFDAVICMGTTFGFFDDEANRDVLARLYGALRPGGRLLLDVVNRDFVIRSQPNLVWFQGDGCVCMEESEFNYFSSRLQVKRTMMHEDGRQTEAEYSVRLYSLHELGWLVRQMGFRVLEVSGQEATRGMFFGIDAPRLVMLAERQAVTGENRNPESL